MVELKWQYAFNNTTSFKYFQSDHGGIEILFIETKQGFIAASNRTMVELKFGKTTRGILRNRFFQSDHGGIEMGITPG